MKMFKVVIDALMWIGIGVMSFFAGSWIGRRTAIDVIDLLDKPNE